MAQVQTPPANAPPPAWLIALDKKRERVHRLGHEIGAGSRCLVCNDDCPGLDLHFWRKICRNCKCKKEEHDVIDDDYYMEQFEILLGSNHSNNRPNKAFLEMLEKHTSAGFKNKLKSLAFDWVPPDVSPIIAAEYMQALPANKLPISGSDGALYRRQQLERQLPLHDLDANQCHQLTDAEVENLEKYLENLKNNVVGQGRVTKLSIPTSSSLDSLQKVCTYNSVPKPYQSSIGSSTSSNTQPHFNVEGQVDSLQHIHLKTPSAFWPKRSSPEPYRSLSPAADALLPSVTDRGAAFGVTLSPASEGRRATSKIPRHGAIEPGQLLPTENRGMGQLNCTGQFVKDQIATSLSQSTNVPGSMWVPSECEECSRKDENGQLVKSQFCKHTAVSSDVAHKIEPFACTDCVQKIVDGQLVKGHICTHIASSSINPHIKAPAYCSECVQKAFDGKLVKGQMCTHITSSSINPSVKAPAYCAECVQRAFDGKLVKGQLCTHITSSSTIPNIIAPAYCAECVQRAFDGKLVKGQLCTHIISSSPIPNVIGPAYCTECVQKVTDGKLVKGQMCTHIASSSINPKGISPAYCGECVQRAFDGKLVKGQICTHMTSSSINPGVVAPAYCAECVQKVIDGKMVKGQMCTHIASSSINPKGVSPAYCGECVQKVIDGKMVKGQMCTHITSSSINPKVVAPAYCGECVQKVIDGKLVKGHICTHIASSSVNPNVIAPADCRKCLNEGIHDQICPHIIYADIDHGVPHSTPASKCMTSASSAPHVMALYAHNALNSPSRLHPQDKLSPHVASLSIDDHHYEEIPKYEEIPGGDEVHYDSIRGMQDAVPIGPIPPTNLHCAECSEDILPGEVVVFADRAGSDMVWHPKCFVCHTCQELLVDLVYFFNKGHVYCGRHFSEMLDIPRCSACDELIFVKEYTVAEGQDFHVKHFCCFECDEPLGGKQYVPKEGQPVCLPCYELKYGKKCQSCQLVIKAKDQGVAFKHLHWHATPECFLCFSCQKFLLTGRFAVRDDRPFCCKECMQASLSTNHQKVSAV
ncbi:uncharacterized protein LOC113211450 isoform X1 [Frankliniella occidentalis]|uniref:Uncharacterized protein LOC113211450 isoform X1 n=1 Tax=Frankliniella occidentalis TaxID=133901 RepID=A0A6J1SWI1_FRAOC|nr:uncharacterized protein LOC113211450 isoform X1 [Frankliniella occidentalis]